MSIWDELRGNERSIGMLRSVSASREPTHAYLLTGPPGSGRMAASLALAASLNCLDRGCGTCAQCRQILAGTNPLLIRIAPQGRQILIEQVRELIHRLSLKGGDGWRIAIIQEADAMQAPAANALLKTLEEPFPRSVLILHASHASNVLPTVRSRCQHLAFHPPTGADVVAELIRRGIDPERAERLAEISGGQLARAIRWSEEESLLSWREQVLDAARSIARGETVDVVALRKELLAPFEALAGQKEKEVQAQTAEIKEFGLDAAHRRRIEKAGEQQARRAASREEASGLHELAFVLASWCREFLAGQETTTYMSRTSEAALHSNNPLPDHPNNDKLSKLTTSPTSAKMITALEAISEAEKLLGYNVDSGLWTESLLVRLQGCFVDT